MNRCNFAVTFFSSCVWFAGSTTGRSTCKSACDAQKCWQTTQRSLVPRLTLIWLHESTELPAKAGAGAKSPWKKMSETGDWMRLRVIGFEDTQKANAIHKRTILDETKTLQNLLIKCWKPGNMCNISRINEERRPRVKAIMSKREQGSTIQRDTKSNIRDAIGCLCARNEDSNISIRGEKRSIFPLISNSTAVWKNQLSGYRPGFFVRYFKKKNTLKSIFWKWKQPCKIFNFM